MIPNRALEEALALWRAPRLARAMRSRPLPEGLTLILKILSGDLQALAEARRLTPLDDNDILGVAELYVLRVMLYRGAPPHRVLGVGPGAERGQIRRHMSWLMNWLHPDKNANPWRAVFLHRVLDAWRQIGMGTEEDWLPPPSIVTKRRRRPFLIPWISEPPPQRIGRFLGGWRRLMRLWGIGLILVQSAIAFEDVTSVGAFGSSSVLVTSLLLRLEPYPKEAG